MKQITLLVHDGFEEELLMKLYLEDAVGTLTMRDAVHYMGLKIAKALMDSETIVELHPKKVRLADAQRKGE